MSDLTEELAIFQHVEGPKPTGVTFTGVPITRKRIKKTGEEIVELQGIRFTGETIDEVRERHASHLSSERQKNLNRESYLREIAERRAKKAEAAS